MKLCMRKCEIVKKKLNSVYVRLKKNVMRTGLFTGHFANGRYAISIIATLHWNKKMFLKRMKSQNCRLERYNEKTNSKFPTK